MTRRQPARGGDTLQGRKGSPRSADHYEFGMAGTRSGSLARSAGSLGDGTGDLAADRAVRGGWRIALRMGAISVDAEHLYAALSAYLLAGIFFGLFYWVLEQIVPGSFATAGEFSRMSALYFSFVTLATLGYGDIVPRTEVTRGLAIVEGVGGQLFLAVMVARLFSLYGRKKADNS